MDMDGRGRGNRPRPFVRSRPCSAYSRLQIAANTSDACLINETNADEHLVRCAVPPTDRVGMGRHRKVFQLFTNALSRRGREGEISSLFLSVAAAATLFAHLSSFNTRSGRRGKEGGGEGEGATDSVGASGAVW